MSELQYDNGRGYLSSKETQTLLRIEEGLKSQVEISRKTTYRGKYKSLERANNPFCHLEWAVYKDKMKNLEKSNVRDP